MYSTAFAIIKIPEERGSSGSSPRHRQLLVDMRGRKATCGRIIELQRRQREEGYAFTDSEVMAHIFKFHAFDDWDLVILPRGNGQQKVSLAVSHLLILHFDGGVTITALPGLIH